MNERFHVANKKGLRLSFWRKIFKPLKGTLEWYEDLVEAALKEPMKYYESCMKKYRDNVKKGGGN